MGKMIKFKLKNIDDIIPFGSDGNQTIHWFGLTYGEYWLEIKNIKIFEYSDEILSHWGGQYKYVDYQIIRFIEDFSSLFFKITESIPSDLFDYVKSPKLLDEIEGQRRIWAGISYDKEMVAEESFKWITDRTLDSSHLTGGPRISFFRNDKKNITCLDCEPIK